MKTVLSIAMCILMSTNVWANSSTPTVPRAEKETAEKQNTALGGGGMDGGGGGLIPEKELTASHIGSWADALKGTVLSYLFKRQHHNEPLPGNLDIDQLAETIRRTEINIIYEDPCYDRFGNVRDGSIVKTNQICLSAANLVEKLTLSNYIYQTSALALHEYSHLLGADESVAEKLQEEFIKYAKSLLARDFVKVQDTADDAFKKLAKFHEKLELIEKNADLWNWDLICDELDEGLSKYEIETNADQLNGIVYNPDNWFFPLVSTRDAYYTGLLSAKHALLVEGVKANSKECLGKNRERYENYFGQQSSLDIEEVFKERQKLDPRPERYRKPVVVGGLDNLPPVRKITSKEVLKVELAEIKAGVMQLIQQILDDHNEHRNKYKVNYWYKFEHMMGN